MMLVTDDAGGLSTASGSGNLELHINLNGKEADNSSSTIKTGSNTYLSVPSIELNSSIVTVPPLAILVVDSLAKANRSTTIEPRLISTLSTMDLEFSTNRNSNQSQTFSMTKTNSHISGEIRSDVSNLSQFDPPNTTQQPLKLTDEFVTIDANVTEKPATNASVSPVKPSITISLDQGNSSTIIATINTTQINPSTLIQQAADPALVTHPPPLQELPADIGRSSLPVSINFSRTEPVSSSLQNKLLKIRSDGDPNAVLPPDRAAAGSGFGPQHTVQLNTSLTLERTKSHR